MSSSKQKAAVAWFVEPSTVTLDLGDGFWVEVKKELTVRESAEVQASLVKTVQASGKVEPDFQQLWKANTCAYIVDWNLEQKGKKVAFSTSAVDNMSRAGWDRVQAAVQAHIEAMEAAREGKAGGSTSKPASPSAE